MKRFNNIHRNLLLPALVLALVIALPATAPAGGTDDGGGRSILAEGAGNRALALGGAYAAIGEDASAILWNPAGLAGIQRREFQAAHTNLIGLGFSEQYAAVALPSWRWGVTAFSFHRFGVDGIEWRDDRNLLLDDNLKDSESELALAFGRELDSAWRLGAALKLRRQDLAGFNDSGIGLDLGLMVKPLLAAGSRSHTAEDLTLGVTIRNAVEPSLRLDQESVPDPTGIRFGTGYRHTLGRSGHVLAMVDLEKTRDMNTHLHAGTEICLVPAFSLRLGVNQGTFTAGTGIRWQDVGVDYCFENLPDNSVHRFGATFHFGASREEKRLAAVAAAEQELQDRLADEFDRRNSRRRDELLERVEQSLAGGDVQQATDLIAMAKVIDPDAARVRELEIAILLRSAALREEGEDFSGALVLLTRLQTLDPGHAKAAAMMTRLRAASDARSARSTEIRQLLDSALDAFAAGRLTEARTGFERVVALDPADAEALAMLGRTETAIVAQAKNLLEQARTLGRAGSFVAARSKWDEAAACDPDVPGLRRTADQLAAWEETATAAAAESSNSEPSAELAGATPTPSAPTAPAGPAPLSESRRRELGELYERGIAAVEAGEPDQAVHFWELVRDADPDFQQVSENLKQYYLNKGMEAFVAGRLQEAVSLWEDAVRVAPEDTKAQGYLQRAREQISRLDRMTG